MIANAILFAVFIVGMCRLRYLDPKHTLGTVAVYYFAIALGAFLGLVARVAAATEWPHWAVVGEILPPLGVLVALLAGAFRWWGGAPDGVKK